MSSSKLCQRCREERAYVRSEMRMNGIPTGTVGAISELIVSADLMKKGFHVFRALSPACPFDLYAMRNHKTFDIEVRTTTRNLNGEIHGCRQKSGGHYFAFVVNGEIIYDPAINNW